MEANLAVDAVILWVDGEDATHKNKIMSYLENPTAIQSKGLATRYRQVNEIEYVVKSIVKFAPFIKNIFIVTDEQTPDFLKNSTSSLYENVKIIDHKVIFDGYLEFLPVFNSNAIETMIHRIPELAENYVYFNDDMFLIKPTTVADFFTKEGLPLIRARRKSFESDKIFKKIAIKTGIKKEKKKGYLGYSRIQDYFAQQMGESTKLTVDHTPFPMKKSLITHFFEDNDSVFKNNISFKFRNEKNVLIQSVSAYSSVKVDPNVVVSDYKLKKLSATSKPLFWLKMQLSLAQKNKNKLFLNIQSLDLYPKEKMNYMINWLENLYR